MPAETLAATAIIARAKGLEQALNSEFAAALVGVAGRRDVKEARRLLDHFYVNHGRRLVDVCEELLAKTTCDCGKPRAIGPCTGSCDNDE